MLVMAPAPRYGMETHTPPGVLSGMRAYVVALVGTHAPGSGVAVGVGVRVAVGVAVAVGVLVRVAVGVAVGGSG